MNMVYSNLPSVSVSLTLTMTALTSNLVGSPHTVIVSSFILGAIVYTTSYTLTVNIIADPCILNVPSLILGTPTTNIISYNVDSI